MQLNYAINLFKKCKNNKFNIDLMQVKYKLYRYFFSIALFLTNNVLIFLYNKYLICLYKTL